MSKEDEDLNNETEIIDDVELLKLAGSGLCRPLAKADMLDRNISEYIHNINSIAVEIVLFPFGHFFNRFYNLLGFLLTLVVGAYRYDHMMVATGY